MIVYVLAQLTIHDRARYDRYAARFMGVLEKFEGRLLAADESPALLEGDWPHEKVVLIEFEDLDGRAAGDYYYVRVQQLDGGLAFTSPFWVGRRDS